MVCNMVQALIMPVIVRTMFPILLPEDLPADNIKSSTVNILAKELTSTLINTKILLPSSLFALFSMSATGMVKKMIQLVIIYEIENTTHNIAQIIIVSD